MKNKIKLLCVFSLIFPLQLNAELSSLDEQELDAVYGQAIFEVKDQFVEQADGSELEMVRLTVGARVEINLNAEEVVLGRYWRPEGTDCTGGAHNQVCYNSGSTPVYDESNNLDWACTGNPCGNVGLSDGDYLSSDKTHNVGEASFFDTGIFPSGYQPENGADVKIRDLTMGQVNCVNGVCDLTPFVQENPYFEFAFEESGGVRELVGFRLGAEDTYGYQGQVLDVISGFVKPSIEAEAKLLGISVGTIKGDVMLGGVRTIGFLDAKTSVVTETGGLTGVLVGNSQDLVDQSPHAQLFPVQSNYMDHTEAFFVAAGIKPITWSKVGTYTPYEAAPGFWFNLGGDGGLVSQTQKGDHPVNYFPGHPKHTQYALGTRPQQNYTNPQGTWSTTYTK